MTTPFLTTTNIKTYNEYIFDYVSCIFTVFFGVLFLYTGQIYGKFIYRLMSNLIFHGQLMK